MLPKTRSIGWCAAILLTLSFSPANTRAQAPRDAETERKLITILKEGAPDEKAITCKKLAVYGSDEAVPVLAPLLLDPQLASWARIALEAIPGEAASAALRDAVPKLQGRLLVGTINSIGVRRDRKAVDQLAGKLNDNDTDVLAAAAVALGRISGPEAATVLERALPATPQPARGSVAEGCIRCAEHFLTDGRPGPAIELYDLVRKSDVPKENILEGVRGAILARKDGGIPLLVEQLHSTDRELFRIGLRAARELPGTKATKTVASEMRRATPEHQPLLLLALADRGDEAGMSTILDSAKSGPKNLRMVAVGILDRMGKPSTMPTLIEVAEGNDADLTQAALVALTRLPGSDLDAKLLDNLGKASGKKRQVLIELAARRQIEGAVPVIVKDAESKDAPIRSAAVQALGILGGTAQVNELVRLFSSAADERQRQELETAILAISSRLGNGCAQALLPLAHNSDASVRKVALHALASAGGSEALTAVKQSVEDKDESVQDEAVRTLSTWPNTWPEDEGIAQPLLGLAKNSKKPTYQVLAVRGYLQFLEGDKKMRGDEKLAKVEEALPLINRPEEKRSAIAVVQTVPSGQSLEILSKFAADSALTDDACSAMVDLASKNTPGMSKDARRTALQTAIEKSTNEDTKKRAQAALDKIR